MGVFKELDPDVARRAIEGYQDEITPAAKAQDAFYRQFSCPRCTASLQKEFNVKTAFNGETIVPKALLKCSDCGYTIEPHTGLVIARGDMAMVPIDINALGDLKQGQ